MPVRVFAEQSFDGFSCQLLNIGINPQGNLIGTVRVENSTERQNIFYSFYPIVNECFQSSSSLYIRLLPHCSTARSFEIPNTVSALFQVRGTDSWTQLGSFELMQRMGIRQIDSIRFLDVREHDYSDGMGGEVDVRSLAFQLNSPIPFASPEEIRREAEHSVSEFRNLLLDGDVQVNAERILAGEEKVGMLLSICSRSSRDLCFQIAYGANGIPANQLPQDTFSLGAGTTVMKCIVIPVSGNALRSLELSFSYDSFTASLAILTMLKPAERGLSGGVELSEADYALTPAKYERFPASIPSKTIFYEGGSITLEMLGLVSQPEQGLSFTEEPSSPGDLTARFTIECTSDDDIDYTLCDFIFNGGRLAGTYCFPEDSNADGKKTASAFFKISELSGLGDIRSIDCTLEILNYSQETEALIPLHWDIRWTSEVPLPALGNPLAAASADGLRWELLSITPKTAGGVKTTES